MRERYYKAHTLGAKEFQVQECFSKLGEAILSEHLQAAAEFFLHGTPTVSGHGGSWSREKVRQMTESLAFISGTGVEMICEAYGVEVNPDTFKETFFQWIQTQKRTLHHTS